MCENVGPGAYLVSGSWVSEHSLEWPLLGPEENGITWQTLQTLQAQLWANDG